MIPFARILYNLPVVIIVAFYLNFGAMSLSNKEENYCKFISLPTTIPIIGLHTEDAKRIRSSIDYSFDTYRSELTTFMTLFDTTVSAMDAIDEKCHFLSDIHEDFRKMAMSIPENWEKNELFLRILLDASCLNIIIGIQNQTSTSFISSENYSKPNGGIQSYNTLTQLLIHLARDWTERGEAVRKNLYKNGILKVLQQYILKRLK